MTGSVKPSPPAPPNGGALSAGQSYGDVQTAIGNTIMANANEQNPYGAVNYSITGNRQIQIPIFNNQGAFQGMQTIDVPQYNKSTTLTPIGQQMLDAQNNTGLALDNLALSQTQRLQGVLGQPIDASALPARTNTYGAAPTFQNVGTGPTLDRTGAQFGGSGTPQVMFADTGPVQRSIGPTDYASQRSEVENAILSRVNPQLDRDRAALETKLVNQGLVRGTEAFNTAMDEANRQANDARMQAVLAGGQEQSRLAGLDLQKGQFANTAEQQAYNEALSRNQFYNAAQQQIFDQAQQRGLFGMQAAQQNNQAAQQEFQNQQATAQFNNANAQQAFGNTQAAAQFGNENRDKALQELLSLRNQPINEITALLGGQQVTVPQFQNYSAGTIPQNNLAQNIFAANQLAQQNYQTQQSGTNALLGALGGVAGAGLYGLGRKYG